MKALVLISLLLCTSISLAQKKNNDKNFGKGMNELLAQKDSLIQVIRDSVLNLSQRLKNIEIPVNTTPEATTEIKNIELNLKTTMIAGNEWAITTLGASSVLSLEDKISVDSFLIRNNFVRCTSEEEWNNNLNESAYLVAAGNVAELGYFFNLKAIKKLSDLLISEEWRIATNEDFKAMFKHAANLKITGLSPFQLLAGNPSSNDLKTISSWKNQIVHDIYGLQMSPYSYYSGIDALLNNEAYVEYFSHFSGSEEVYVTHISPEDKNEPLNFGYGPEASNYGFFIRLIKNK